MKALTIVFTALSMTTIAMGSSVCPTSPLSTYLGNGTNFACTDTSGQITSTWNNSIVPSYAGLSVLGGTGTNSSVAPANINVVPENLGFDFQGAFSENGLLGAQAELVHFTLDSGTKDITSVTLNLDNAQVSDGGGLGLGLGLIVGQEILCIGGHFTSLPVGVVTSLVGNQFGCNGAAVMGTAAVSAGVLADVTGILGLPNLNGLTDSVTLQLSPVNPTEIDVIKLQAVVSALGGSASDVGFGNTYTLTSGSSATPEPGSTMLMLAAGVLLTGNKLLARWLKIGGRKESAGSR